MSLISLITAGVQLIAGIVLTATGIGGGLGLKLILSGALSLISSFMTAKAGRGGLSSSPTYGFDNLSNAAREGGPIPVIYGRHVLTPSIINLSLKQEGSQQTLYLLLLLGEGEIDSVEQVWLNGVKIEQFPGATATAKNGTSDQTAFADFSQIGTGYEAGTHLGAGETHTHEMRGAADEVALDFTWPGGMYKIDGDGIKESNVGILIQYRDFASTSEADWTPFTIPAAGQGNGQWYKDPSPSGKAGIWKTAAKTRSTLRRMLRLQFDGQSGRPSRGRYQIRVVGQGDDSGQNVRVPTITNVIEIQNDSRAYANRALLAVKCPALAQLNGGIPEVRVQVKGLKVTDPRTSTTAWSQNPAIAVRDLLLSTRYGLGQWVTSSMIDDGVGGSFRTVADACDASVTHGTVTEAKWKLDYVLDALAPATDHLTQMLTTFRATLFAADGLIRISQDTTGSTSSDRHFEDTAAGSASTRRNVLHEAGEEGYGDRSLLTAHLLEDSQRWNVVRVRYVDADRAWQQRVIAVRNKSIPIGAITGAFQAGEMIRAGTAAAGRFVFQRGGLLYYVQDDDATAIASGNTITGQTSGATCSATSSPTTEESPERALEVNLFGVTRRTQALREARYSLNRALMTPVFVQVPHGLGDMGLLPGDVFDVSSDFPAAWSSKKFTCLSITYDQKGGGVVVGREYHADVYADTVDLTILDAPATVQPGGTPSPPQESAPTFQASGSFFSSGIGVGQPFGGLSSAGSAPATAAAATNVKTSVLQPTTSFFKS